MNKHIEGLIIKAFIIERKKERARYELFNDKKRDGFLWKVQASSHIDPGCMKKILEPISAYQDVYDILKKNGAPDACYVMKGDSLYDGQIVPLTQGLKDVLFDGPGILSCIHGMLAFLEGEQRGGGGGAPDRFLLLRNM
jgi:hypothetical protein